MHCRIASLSHCLTFVTVLIAGCGGSGATVPTIPSAPIIPQVAGAWSGTLTQTQATGGPECLAAVQQSTGAAEKITLAVTQTGTDLTATSTASDTGETCSFYGTAGNTDALALQAMTCQPALRSLDCGGMVRDLYRIERLITANVTGNAMSGTDVVNWSVFPAGATVGSLGVVTTTATVSLTR